MADEVIRSDRMAGVGRLLGGVVILGASVALLLNNRMALFGVVGGTGVLMGVVVFAMGALSWLYPPQLTLSDAGLVFRGLFGTSSPTPWRDFARFYVDGGPSGLWPTYEFAAHVRTGNQQHRLYGVWTIEPEDLVSRLEARRTASER